MKLPPPTTRERFELSLRQGTAEQSAVLVDSPSASQVESTHGDDLGIATLLGFAHNAATQPPRHSAVKQASKPFAPPRLTRNEAEARSLLAQHVHQREVVLGDMAWEFSMEPLAQGAARAFGSLDWRVCAEWAGAPFELRLPATAADQWLRARFTSLELPQLPAPIRTAAFESALHDMLIALEATGQGPARIDSVDEAAAPTAATVFGHHFGLALAHGGLTLWATLSTDSLGLMLMAGLAARWPVALGPIARADVPVLLRAEVGTATISRAEIASLNLGDAILLQQNWVDQEGHIWLEHAGWGLRVRAEGSRLIVTEPFHSKETQMHNEFNELDEAEGLASTVNGLKDGFERERPTGLDALPVRLHFDLGQRTLPLREVSELQVGQVLELTRPLSQAVSIRANGALIGMGELIEIGGRIAVGITSLGSTRGAEE